jgi:hypothetical protein
MTAVPVFPAAPVTKIISQSPISQQKAANLQQTLSKITANYFFKHEFARIERIKR